MSAQKPAKQHDESLENAPPPKGSPSGEQPTGLQPGGQARLCLLVTADVVQAVHWPAGARAWRAGRQVPAVAICRPREEEAAPSYWVGEAAKSIALISPGSAVIEPARAIVMHPEAMAALLQAAASEARAEPQETEDGRKEAECIVLHGAMEPAEADALAAAARAATSADIHLVAHDDALMAATRRELRGTHDGSLLLATLEPGAVRLRLGDLEALSSGTPSWQQRLPEARPGEVQRAAAGLAAQVWHTSMPDMELDAVGQARLQAGISAALAELLEGADEESVEVCLPAIALPERTEGSSSKKGRALVDWRYPVSRGEAAKTVEPLRTAMDRALDQAKEQALPASKGALKLVADPALPAWLLVPPADTASDEDRPLDVLWVGLPACADAAFALRKENRRPAP